MMNHQPRQTLADELKDALIKALRNGVPLTDCQSALGNIYSELVHAGPMIAAVVEHHTGFDPT